MNSLQGVKYGEGGVDKCVCCQPEFKSWNKWNFSLPFTLRGEGEVGSELLRMAFWRKPVFLDWWSLVVYCLKAFLCEFTSKLLVRYQNQIWFCKFWILQTDASYYFLGVVLQQPLEEDDQGHRRVCIYISCTIFPPTRRLWWGIAKSQFPILGHLVLFKISHVSFSRF